MTHSASRVPSMMTDWRESIQQMGACVEVFMVRWMPEVSISPMVKLLRLSVWDIHIV